jgi:DnaJ-class molecular chaperone
VLVLPRKMDGFKDYYRALKIDSTAEDAAIKSAFRRLALRHHPDRARDKGTADRFQEIREAYEVLSDPEKRRRYDRVYRAQTAAAQPNRTRFRRFGISLDVLGLRVGVAINAGVSRPVARKPKRRRRPR